MSTIAIEQPMQPKTILPINKLPNMLYDTSNTPCITQQTINNLIKAFSMGCTDNEACLMANISLSTLYAFQTINKSFVDKKNKLKDKPLLQARTKVIKDIDKDTNTAKWYLERKAKTEFGKSIEEKAHITNNNIVVSESEAHNLLDTLNKSRQVIEADVVEVKPNE